MPTPIRDLAMAVAAALALVAPAQAVEVFNANDKSSYLRTNGDSPPAPAPVMLDLTGYGWVPGTELQLRTAGDFDQGPGGGDVEYAVGIYSSSPTLLARNLQVRVHDAIAAGQPYVTAPAFFGGLPTDVPQDFRFDPDGDCRYLIGMAPVPEPATGLLPLAGVGALLAWRRANGPDCAPQRRTTTAKTLAAEVLPAQSETLAKSRFDAPGSDGWLVADLRYPDIGAPPVVLGTYTPTWNAGGFLSHPDPGNNAWYWLARAACLGDKLSAYGGTLGWEVAITGNGFGSPPYFMQEDIVLVGASRSLVQTTGVVFAPTQSVDWFRFEVGLTAGGWRIGNGAGPLATEADLRAVLAALDALYLRGECLNALDDIGGLDNVVLTAVP